jgi:nitric oxide reductase NorD protein
VETPDNQAPMLVMFRAESLPTWAEYVKVNRAYDDEEDPNAKNVANDLDKLSLTRDGKTAVSRVKFDLDLPSAAEDDTPIGPGIALPEWDYRKSVMLEKHCRVQPMVAHDAVPADLPEALAATAKKLRGQFAALTPQRRWLKAQQDGAELDVDACVRNHADRHSGHTPESGGYLAQARCERDLACLLLADLSMSTDAWISDTHRIVDVIRDSLLLFSEKPSQQPAIASASTAFRRYAGKTFVFTCSKISTGATTPPLADASWPSSRGSTPVWVRQSVRPPISFTNNPPVADSC